MIPKKALLELYTQGESKTSSPTFEVHVSNPEGENTKHPPPALGLVGHVMGLNRVGKPCKNKGVQLLHDETVM